jgi:hypothetical protein
VERCLKYRFRVVLVQGGEAYQVHPHGFSHSKSSSTLAGAASVPRRSPSSTILENVIREAGDSDGGGGADEHAVLTDDEHSVLRG